MPLRTTGHLTRVVVVALCAVGMTVGAASVASAVGPPPWAPGPPFGDPGEPDPAIDLIGTWGLDVVDVEGLCVSIDVPHNISDREAIGQEIYDAFNDWMDAVAAADTIGAPGFTWRDDTDGAWDGSNTNCAGDDVGPVDVSIRVLPGGGQIQGTTNLSYEDGAGYDPPSAGSFIQYADIVLRGRFQGNVNGPEQVGLIARHEIGHALGIGHWNVQGQLMSSFLVDEVTTLPNACEIEAVLIANDWYLSGALQPSTFDAADDPYECDPT